MTVSRKKALERWLGMDDDDDNKITEIKEQIKMLLYNKRNIPIKTIDNVKQTTGKNKTKKRVKDGTE